MLIREKISDRKDSESHSVMAVGIKIECDNAIWGGSLDHANHRATDQQ